ncbi:hypothetical protein AZSI13_09150 [Azospira sp. I13]|uniref:hypothetical protein n=1 Tax=Azospira sp. I13 TaxID=1765050 RepID=UPI000D4A18E4|nr:hypothetical protein [Azospira sp. I13]GBG01588.1 hypothetical protein AZSI13_09150 [Azospira sp. I13]
MAETENISKMAELLASAIFKELKWQQEAPLNTNYSCVLTESHGKKTHPADVVYWYKDPYKGSRIYVLTDLKSYARGSITADTVKGSVTNLALSVECAKISDEWRRRFISGSDNTDLVGMLFIFNHDQGWDAEFPTFLGKMFDEYPRIPSGVRLYIFGPQDIWYLNNIIFDMKALRGDGELPQLSDCSFLYPDLSRSKVVQDDWGCAATLECLKAPWQIIKYRMNDGSIHLLIYYRGAGETVQEFIYLIDKLVHFQWVAMCATIRLRAPYASQNAAATFALAVKEYADPLGESTKDSEKLKKIRLETIQKVTPNFSEIEIGMEAR